MSTNIRHRLINIYVFLFELQRESAAGNFLWTRQKARKISTQYIASLATLFGYVVFVYQRAVFLEIA